MLVLQVELLELLLERRQGERTLVTDVWQVAISRVEGCLRRCWGIDWTLMRMLDHLVRRLLHQRRLDLVILECDGHLVHFVWRDAAAHLLSLTHGWLSDQGLLYQIGMC